MIEQLITYNTRTSMEGFHIDKMKTRLMAEIADSKISYYLIKD